MDTPVYLGTGELRAHPLFHCIFLMFYYLAAYDRFSFISVMSCLLSLHEGGKIKDPHCRDTLSNRMELWQKAAKVRQL